VKPQFILTALDRFSCLADRCPIDCCSRFRVDVESAAYDRWRSLANTDEHKASLLDGVCRGENVGKTGIILRNKPDSRDCVFLTPDRLCSIHAGMGPELLPEICREYPRKKVVQPNLVVAYGAMSCIEMARLVMFDGTGPVFRHVGGTGRDRGKKVAKSANEQVVRCLYNVIRKVLASSDYPLNLRLTCLAQVVADITVRSERQQLRNEDLVELERHVDQRLHGLGEAVRSGNFTINPVHGAAMWNLLRTGAMRFRLFERSGLPEEMSVLELARRAETKEEAKSAFYQELISLRQRHGPQLRPFERAFERYLESRFMADGFPLAQRHPVVAFISSVFPFAFIQMLLWMKASVVSSELTENDILEAVVRVEENLCHNDELSKTVENNRALRNLGGYLDWFLEVG